MRVHSLPKGDLLKVEFYAPFNIELNHLLDGLVCTFEPRNLSRTHIIYEHG
jgi:hypothetical protein